MSLLNILLPQKVHFVCYVENGFESIRVGIWSGQCRNPGEDGRNFDLDSNIQSVNSY